MTTAPANAAPLRGQRPWPLAMPWVTLPLAFGVVAFSILLWPEWTSNPDLSHGLFAPMVFALLLMEGRRTGTQRWLTPGKALTSSIVVAAIGSVTLFAMAGLLAASLQWTHSLVYFVLAASLATGLFAGLLCLADARVHHVPFNWTILTAIGLWVLAAPLPEGTYARLTLGLQGMVTSGVLNALHILGVPAQRLGNIIELANTSVGVEEACSGIRSLLSCVYAGFLFAAWFVRGAARRLAIILIAPLLAIAMNFARSLGLTLIANAGTDITGFWHDATGFAILGITAVILALLASALGQKTVSAAATATTTETRPQHRASFRTTGSAVVATAAIAVALLAAFFAFYRPTATPAVETAPEILALLPANPPGWRSGDAKNLYQFSDVLRTTHLGERTYVRQVDGEVRQITVYVAHWPSGQAPVSLVASHTPDACWPGSGWVAQPDRYHNALLTVDGRALPVAEQRFFMNGEYPQYVWFWHIYDGRVVNYRDPYSVPALLELALQYGFRRQGAQNFIRISSNQPWEKLSDDPLIAAIVSSLSPLGLAP